MEILRLSILFFMLFNPLGALPIFLALLNRFSSKKQRTIIIRENLLALIIAFVFLTSGKNFFKTLGISLYSFQIGGGLMLGSVGLRMMFSKLQTSKNSESNSDPLFFPLAFPIITGPAVLTNLMTFLSESTCSVYFVSLAIFISWFVSLLVLLSTDFLNKIFGRHGLFALEKLVGVFLSTISGNLIVKGLLSAFNFI